LAGETSKDTDQTPPRGLDFYEYVAAGFAVVLLAFLAWLSIWPFHENPPARGNDPSIWEVLIYDRAILGFLRAGIVAVVTYVGASVFALVIARRWMKGLGKAGLTTDAAGKTEDTIADLRKTVADQETEIQRLLSALDYAEHVIDLFEESDEG
jgi:hypothetical protein